MDCPACILDIDSREGGQQWIAATADGTAPLDDQVVCCDGFVGAVCDGRIGDYGEILSRRVGHGEVAAEGEGTRSRERFSRTEGIHC